MNKLMFLLCIMNCKNQSVSVSLDKFDQIQNRKNLEMKARADPGNFIILRSQEDVISLIGIIIHLGIAIAMIYYFFLIFSFFTIILVILNACSVINISFFVSIIISFLLTSCIFLFLYIKDKKEQEQEEKVSALQINTKIPRDKNELKKLQIIESINQNLYNQCVRLKKEKIKTFDKKFDDALSEYIDCISKKYDDFYDIYEYLLDNIKILFEIEYKYAFWIKLIYILKYKFKKIEVKNTINKILSKLTIGTKIIDLTAELNDIYTFSQLGTLLEEVMDSNPQVEEKTVLINTMNKVHVI